MAPNPADRPSAREVLQSDYLPPRVEDEQLKDLLRSLPDNPETYERVVDALFTVSAAAAATRLQGPGSASPGSGASMLGAAEAPGAPQAASVHLRDAVLRHVRNVFACHGLVPMTSAQVRGLHCLAAILKESMP